MSVNAKENDYTCKTCKYWDDDGCFCMHNGMNAWSEDTCDNWTDPDEVEPTEDEKRANAGCDEAHRIMVEGRERL